MGDGARAVREEDAFDVPAVDRWLRQQTELPAGLPEVKQFSGGASNLTYLLRYDGHDLILRRPPAGTKAKGAHDMGREYRIQAGLKPVFPYVPTMV
ncbi:MAG TPA: phosphotransferase, partial [Kribbella sp.]|nr:phosphotransferase [Kribbella sp.]